MVLRQQVRVKRSSEAACPDLAAPVARQNQIRVEIGEFITYCLFSKGLTSFWSLSCFSQQLYTTVGCPLFLYSWEMRATLRTDLS